MQYRLDLTGVAILAKSRLLLDVLTAEPHDGPFQGEHQWMVTASTYLDKIIEAYLAENHLTLRDVFPDNQPVNPSPAEALDGIDWFGLADLVESVKGRVQ